MVGGTRGSQPSPVPSQPWWGHGSLSGCSSPPATFSQLYLQRVSIYFKTNCVCEPATYGPPRGPGTSALLRAIPCNLGSSLPKRRCHQHGQCEDRTELGRQEVLRFKNHCILLFFPPLAPLIHAGSMSLLCLLAEGLFHQLKDATAPTFLVSPN